MAPWLSVAVLIALVQVAASSIDGVPHVGPEGRSDYYCGYEVESHGVRGTSGYEPTTFRLPAKRSGKARGQPVLLQHDMASNGDEWFWFGEYSLPCLLSENGYDVWVTNIRGSRYSYWHTNYYPLQLSFWQFSFENVAVEDLPPLIDHILAVTNKTKVFYVGHGLGATMGLVLLCDLPEYNSKVGVAVSLSPICYARASWMQKFLSRTAVLVKDLIELVIPTKLFIRSTDSEDDEKQDFIYEMLKTERYFTDRDASVMRAYDPYRWHVLDIASPRTIFARHNLVLSGGFHGYDYTPQFGHLLRRITTPQFIMYGDNDGYITEESVKEILRWLPKNVGKMHLVRVRHFSLNSFMYDPHAPKHVYDIVLGELNSRLPPPPTTRPPPTTTTPVNPECVV